MYDVATEGQTSEVAYFSLFPGSTEQVAKRAYVTGIDDQVCGVSAYRLVSIPARKKFKCFGYSARLNGPSSG